MISYHGDVLGVTEQNPELNQSEGSNPSYGEQANPLDASSDTQTKTSVDEPEPPAELEGLIRSKLVLVGEACEGQNSESGSSNKRRIEEDKTGLGQKTVLCEELAQDYASLVSWGTRTKDDETGAHGSRHGTATNSLESQEHAGNQKNTADGGEHAHGDIWHAGLNVVLANLLEIKASIEASEPAGEGDEHLGQGRVHVHEELALDILGSKSAEAVFVKRND